MTTGNGLLSLHDSSFLTTFLLQCEFGQEFCDLNGPETCSAHEKDRDALQL